jgi:hypothetical protein
MKIKLNLMIFFVFVYVFLMIQCLSVFAELIEPSRMLEGQQKPMGRLSVFSAEPGSDLSNPLLSHTITSKTVQFLALNAPF